jgi:HSP20 family protein
MKEKPNASPEICGCQDNEKYTFEMEVPGVKRKDIDVQVTDDGFSLKAEKDDMIYTGCICLSNEIKQEKTTGTYKEGMLILELPYKEPIKSRKLAIA